MCCVEWLFSAEEVLAAAPFLTPLACLSLVFHSQDPRAFSKWISIVLVWRSAAEFLLLIAKPPDVSRAVRFEGDSAPADLSFCGTQQFHTLALLGFGVADVSLLIALFCIGQETEHLVSKATLVLAAIGAVGIYLADG